MKNFDIVFSCVKHQILHVINICIFLMSFWCQAIFQCLLQHYNLFKLSVFDSSVSYNSGPWLMFLQNMQSVCRWSVSSAFTVVQCNIKVYSSIQGSSIPRPCLCIAAVDFLLSCCFNMWAESSCISQIRANPRVLPSSLLIMSICRG